jgi:PAS domain S-box-containing protein
MGDSGVRPPAPEVVLGEVAEQVIQALEASGVGFAISREEPGVGPVRIYVSRRAAEILGSTVEALLGTSGLTSIPPEELARMAAQRARYLVEGAAPRKFETVIVQPDGTRVPLEVGGTSVDLKGKLSYVSFFWDIRERKETERRLAASEERFRKLIEAAPDAIFVSQGERLHFANTAMAHMLGYERAEDIVGAQLRSMMHPEDAEKTGRRIVEIERTFGPQPPAERRIRRKDGSWAHVEVTTMGIEFDGAPSIIGYGRDMTVRRALQAQLLQADRMAAVGALAAGVAHEINNPLAYVMLNLDLVVRQLRRAGDTVVRANELADKLAEAREGAERVALIVKDLLSFARSEESWGPINLRDCVDGALKMVRSELRGRAQLELDWGDLPPVDGNQARLGQVFLNLLINAVQALPAIHPEKNRIRIIAFGDSGQAVVEVHDNGQGIEEAALSRIFEPFFTTKPTGEGTGLGLSICHSIVTSMGGDLTARNLPTGGACFRVALPRSGSKLHRS